MSDKPPNRQRGIPLLAWHQDGIRLHVLTNKHNGCTVWKEHLEAYGCQKWQSTANLKQALSKFLQ